MPYKGDIEIYSSSLIWSAEQIVQGAYQPERSPERITKHWNAPYVSARKTRRFQRPLFGTQFAQALVEDEIVNWETAFSSSFAIAFISFDRFFRISALAICSSVLADTS
jgi:hypothetical protein